MTKKRAILHLTYDEHIIDALQKIKFPIIGVGGKKFYVREKARNETGIEHIARKDHRLKVRDIEAIAEILMHPKFVCTDPDNPVYKNYYGIRKGEKQTLLLKIVTSPLKNDKSKEEIITIYPANSIKIEKEKKRR